MTEELYKLLTDVERGLDDCIVEFAAEFCDPEKVKEVSQRIYESGGIIGYFTDLRDKVTNFKEKIIK